MLSKKKLIKAGLGLIFIFSFTAFFPQTAGARTDDCSTQQFSDGSSSETLNFPAGGGTNTDAKVTLPIGATITAATVDLAPKNITGTPYIWIPKSIAAGQVVQIDTKTGNIVNTYSVGNNPSRITVMPGGDVWVANRDSANVTKLSPATPPNYAVTGTYSVGGGPRGITFDNKGNVWVGDYDDNTIHKFAGLGSTHSTLSNTTGYPYIYGAIGDAYGYVWLVGDANKAGNRRVVILNTQSNSFSVADACTLNGSNYLYGIGMDSQGNILVNNYGGGGTCKIGGAKSGANFGKVIQKLIGPSGSRGVAVDGNNNVWIANSSNNHVYVYSSAGSQLKDLIPGKDFGAYSDIIGVAIDFDNNAWVVSNGSGRVLKFGAVGSANAYSVLKDINIGSSLYNYSDMTGFRSIPTSMSIGANQFFPASGSTTYTGWESALKSSLTACSCPDASGENQCKINSSDQTKCDVPLSLFSVTGGTYEAKSLNIGCTTAVASVLGGLVPCGRLDNNPSTPWDDTASCNLCFGFLMLQNIVSWLAQIAVGIAVFILVIAGLFYVFSSGDPGKIELAKSVISYALTGLALVFIAWLLTGVIIAALGYSHPFSGGSWNIVDCPIS